MPLCDGSVQCRRCTAICSDGKKLSDVLNAVSVNVTTAKLVEAG